MRQESTFVLFRYRAESDDLACPLLTLAGYYSYLYARCIASSIWHQHCRQDPLSRDTGEKLRHGLLQFGGAKDPAKMLRELLGNDALIASPAGGVSPAPNHLLQELGLTMPTSLKSWFLFDIHSPPTNSQRPSSSLQRSSSRHRGNKFWIWVYVSDL